jgi:large subunit ribosomal protein L4
VGGGVAFGPKPRDYRKTISKTVKRAALKKAISERIRAGEVITVGVLEVAAPRTKDFLTLIASVSGTESALIVSNTFTENTYLAARNVSYVHLVRSADVNAEDLLRYKKVVITTAALEEIAKRINS